VNWWEASLTILDREVKQGRCSSERRDELKVALRHLTPGEGYACLRRELAGRPGWNKFRAGTSLYGWWDEILTVEPVRMASIDLLQEPKSAARILHNLLIRWQVETENVITASSDKLCRDFGLECDSGILSPAELRFLRRLNLDSNASIYIEKWRWSSQMGVAFLSDDGREGVKPELACSRIIESVTSEDGTLQNGWRERLLDLADDQSEVDLSGLSNSDRFIKSLEFWGIGAFWAGGAKLYAPAPYWLKRLAVHF